MNRQGRGLLLAAFLILGGATLVLLAGPDHGVNGWTIAGVVAAVFGLAAAERSADR